MLVTEIQIWDPKVNGNSNFVCSVTCKWNFDAINMKWCDDYFNKIGLKELTENNYEIIGTEILFPGDAVPGNLTEEAAFGR